MKIVEKRSQETQFYYFVQVPRGPHTTYLDALHNSMKNVSSLLFYLNI